jgi:hypothetical protein
MPDQVENRLDASLRPNCFEHAPFLTKTWHFSRFSTVRECTLTDHEKTCTKLSHFVIAVSPSNPDNVMASCDVGLLCAHAESAPRPCDKPSEGGCHKSPSLLLNHAIASFGSAVDLVHLSTPQL